MQQAQGRGAPAARGIRLTSGRPSRCSESVSGSWGSTAGSSPRCCRLAWRPTSVSTCRTSGNSVGALGLAWGVFAIFSGRFSDKIGHRKVLIPAILLFSLLSGLVRHRIGLTGLIVIRALMGAMEGSYCPTSFTAVAAASQPKRRGFNQGLQQSGFALLGLALGPIIATQLLHVVPSWRWVFWIVAIPGLHRRRAAVRRAARAGADARRCADRRDAGVGTVARRAQEPQHRARACSRCSARCRACSC